MHASVIGGVFKKKVTLQISWAAYIWFSIFFYLFFFIMLCTHVSNLYWHYYLLTWRVAQRKQFINGTRSSQKVEKMPGLDASPRRQPIKTLRQWKKTVMENRRITIRGFSEDIDISIGSCCTIFWNSFEHATYCREVCFEIVKFWVCLFAIFWQNNTVIMPQLLRSTDDGPLWLFPAVDIKLALWACGKRN